jgi:predicted AAA+ superfamily ATPase
LKAGEELRCKNLLVITSNKEGEEEFEWFGIKGKVKFIPLWKWLLEQ